MTTPQPPEPSPPHLDPDTLADLQADLLDPADVAAAQRHLDECAQCRADRAALDDVRTTLHDAAAVTGPMPADVAQRLDDALAAAGSEATAKTPAAATTVVPMAARRRTSWHTRLAQAAAVIVLLAAVGGIGYGAFSGSGGDAGGSSTAADSSGQNGAGAERQADGGGQPLRVSQSGRDYTAETLRSAVPGLLGGTDLGSGSKSQGLDAGPEQTDAAAITRCADTLAGEPVTPLAADVGKFDHKPAVVIVLPTPDDPASVDVFAVPPGCPTGEVLQFERVALP